MKQTDIILRALKMGPIEALDLAYLIWGDDGPTWCDSNLRQNIWRLNCILRPEGLAIRSNRRWRARGTYELVRVATEPGHKLFTDGIYPG